MLTKLPGSRILGYVVAAAAGLAIGAGGLALAASTGGVLHACASKKTGTLRLVAKCTKRERPLSWNIRGPQGPPGAKGIPGQQGPAGAPGAQGNPAASVMTARTDAGIGEQGYFAASGPSTISGTESGVTVLTPDAPTIAQDLAVTDLVSSPGDNTRVYVLRVNGADTALTCSILGASHTCTDSVHSVNIPPDSQVAIHRSLLSGTGGGADGTSVLVAWRATG